MGEPAGCTADSLHLPPPLLLIGPDLSCHLGGAKALARTQLAGLRQDGILKALIQRFADQASAGTGAKLHLIPVLGPLFTA